MEEVWVRYKKEPSEGLRNQLVEAYLPLVRYNAERLHVKLPDEIDVNDLAQAGIFGLLDAIEAFDLTRGVKFETYCAQRIRGGILDQLRAMDWVPRLVRSQAHKLNETPPPAGAREALTPHDDSTAEIILPPNCDP